MQYAANPLSRRRFSLLLPAITLFPAAAETSVLSDTQMERFLLDAEILKTRETSVGITNSKRATLSDGSLTHDAHIQVIDEAKVRFETARGVEMNFRDTWKFNVAAYRLDRLLDLRMVPVTVERKFGGDSASFTWWVDNVLMMESQRMKEKIAPPDLHRWNCQMHIVRVFDQLIFNTDRNLQNLLITNAWDLKMIDHTRGFRRYKTLREEKGVQQCDKTLFARLKALTREQVVSVARDYLTNPEIDGVMGRRDRIVKILEKAIQANGESRVLYGWLERREAS